MSDAVRVGLLGLGNWGTTLAKAAGRSGRMTLVSCFARSADTREAFAEAFGCRSADSAESLIADDEIDAVLIATPHSTHLEYVTAAAEAGKHAFVEKPFTLTVEEGRKAIEATRRAGVTLQIGHQRRRQSPTRRIRSLIDSGALGMVQLLEANLSGPSGLNLKPDWRVDPAERPLGGLTALGVHMIDSLQYLVGRAKRVTAVSKPVLARTALDDATSLIIEFDSGPLAQVATSLVIPRVATLAVYGTEGAAWSEEDGTRLFVQGVKDQARHEEAIEPVDALADQLAEFADCVRSGKRPEVDGETALAVIAVVEAAIASAAEGRTVDVAPTH